MHSRFSTSRCRAVVLRARPGGSFECSPSKLVTPFFRARATPAYGPEHPLGASADRAAIWREADGALAASRDRL